MKYFYSLAVAALVLTACSSDEPAGNNGGEPVAADVTASIDGVMSRAHDTSWDNGDAIGISATSAGKTRYANMHYTTTGDGSFSHAGGKATGIFFQDSEEVTFSAYCPFAGTENTAAATISTVKTDNQAVQKSFDFLFASGAKASRSNPVLSFTGAAAFSHRMTRLVIKLVTDVNSGFTADAVKGGSYFISGLKHSGEFNTATGIASATGDAGADWQINAAPADADGSRTYSMILYPQTAGELTLKATIDGADYSCKLTPALAAGVSYSYTVTVKKSGIEVSASTINDWISGGNENVDAEM